MATSSQTIPSAGATSRANRATSVPVERTPGPEKETGARAGTYSRDRLDSDTSSRASNARKNQTAGSTTSKSSSSTRRRQDSLKRAKEIAESNISQSPRRGAHGLRPAHLKTVDAFTGSWERQGNQFRVANVGMGGRIYLRPVTKPGVPAPNGSSLQSPTRAKPPALRVTSVSKLKEEKEQKEKERGKDKGHNEGDEEEDDMSDSTNGHAKTVRTDFTGRESVWTKLSTAQDIHGAPSDIFRHRPRSRRSMSESTVNQAPLRAAALAQTKAFKVVIDRSDGNSTSQHHQSAVAQTFNGLDISIPTFQMSLPRFNDQEQSFMQSSTHTHIPGQITSPASAQFLESIPDGVPVLVPLGSAPLQNARRPLPARRHSQASPYTQSISSFTFDPSAIPSSTETYEPSHQPNITGHETISPAIYDVLANAPNDPSVVRYSPQTGEMVAATPARLIVQITAETFLDYELLSDFFLTVRSYLSIHDLLSLLLARFEWAVNRFDDNGRIIRVRSFAAIRHWILNYFAYDFVPDRRLRLQFTRKLNYLFKLVQSRREYGAPDMKLISDLKKCWNGRCVLYWAGPVDNSLEADILPGGPGLEDEDDYDELDDAAIGSVTEASTDGMYSIPGSPPANYSSGADRDSRQLGQQRHSRTGSGMTFQSDPMSPASEASASTGHRKQYQGGARRDPGSSSNEQKQQGARRHSEGSSDLPSGEGQVNEPQQVVSYPLQTSAYRSVLRGHLLAPASPYVTTAPTSLGIPMVSPTLSPQTVDAPSKRQAGPGVSGSGNPGMKQFIGNIKRALSSKVSSGSGLPYGEISMANGSPIYSNPPHRFDTSLRNNIPVEVLSQNVGGGLGGSNAIDTVRATMRIDLLAEQISMEFQKAIQGTNRQAPRQEDRRTEASNSNQAGRFLPTQHASAIREVSLLSPPEAKQVPSGMTSSSQSIVIFDDTGDSLAMPIVNEMPAGERTPRGSTFEPSLLGSPQSIGSHAIALPRRLSTGDVEVSAREVESGASSGVATPARLPSSNVGHHRQLSYSSVSLRRVASYQSALNRPSIDSFRQIPEEAVEVFDKASQKGRMIPASAVPARSLRRVPGGDLRANHNVADLEIQLTPRPRSTGSIATFASTRESEMLSFGDRITKTFKRDRTDRPLISPGFGTFDAPFKKAIEKDKEVEKKKVSLIRTQSDDRAARRPSFEAVVASFADIPDEDEGGPEATMLKLEGRYVKGAITAAKAAARREKEKEEQKEKEKERLKEQDTGKEGVKRASEKTGPPTGKRKPSTGGGDVAPGKQAASRTTVGSFISEDSYSSIPLLEREPAASPKGKGKGQSTTRNYVGLRPKSGSKRSTTDSFLLDAQEDESSDEYSDNSRRPSDTTINQDGPLDGDRRTNGLVKPHTNQFLSASNPSPHRAFVEPHIGRTGGPTSQKHPAVHNPLALGIHPRHMPFVLGHESKLICEQLTLIEKDALREIDWRDLVDMRWQQTASIVTNWVSYLVAGNPLGVDLVTARFNIMVKWVLSEITLTEAADERAMVIMKFIHIAREARRICNYATLLQLTIALTSTDCTRMKKTWDLVPQMDKDTLRDLEALVSPRRNFASLRSEMEDAPAELGCIPVLALYIHDLTYNAQKPPVVEVDLGMGGAGAEASNPNATRLLINFERYRNTAVIVKNLLRLIDASSKYNFVPVDDVLSHCMWIACLPDEVISAKSRAIEGSMTNTTGQKGTIRH